MPKSKRAQVVSLTKVSKKTREHKGALIQELQENAEKWEYCWLFEVGNMRNAHLKTVRKLWKDSARMFFGRGAVMAKALGTTPEEECRTGIHKVGKQIKGQVGLFFTNSEPDEVISWFDDFRPDDFARAGNKATRTVVIPEGPVMQYHSVPPEPFPHNEEPQLRKLGLRTVMKKGVPTLDAPHELCQAGKTLTPEQAQLLKLIGEKMAEFKVRLIARWIASNGEIVQVDNMEISSEEQGGEVGDDAAEDVMSE
ncbi:hypothetical protein NEOLEDRAFT_1243247 [Neolentinus lepideus HHB14362 ss-1]|uniref:Ribosome assembly factor mrt4 n=1 Tax=Neolentinus lepideus HHB14362 ss-1 TaxID=1314782 RepID=A0A165R8U7_9AGAM|nr:hypothetical protein NEOLEDRAFT_1243247 [Neolentinus lepideus HHB14362 ss-1]